MADADLMKQRLRSKLDTIDIAIHMYHVRVAAYMEEKDKICEQAKAKIVNKISSEFCRLFLALDVKQKQMMNELDAIFQKVFEKEMLMPNGEQSEIAVANLITYKSKVDSLLTETKKATFFQESSKIGQEIEQNLDAIQFDQFEEAPNPVNFPNFDFDLNEYIKSVDYIVLQQEIVNTVESVDSNVSIELDIESQPVINQLRHLSPEAHRGNEVPPITDENAEIQENIPSSPEIHIDPLSEATEQTSDPILNEPISRIVPFQTLSQTHKYKFVVTHVGSPSYIYLQLLTKEFNQMIPDITKYHADIDSNPEKMEVVTSASVQHGKYFFAKYEIDNCWYRALILSKQTDDAQVYFIDYGNTDNIPIENLRRIPEKFATYPQQAFIGSLHNIKPNGSDVTIITPSNTDEWTLPSLKYQWDNEVTQWVDVVLDAHRVVYGDISQCGESNHLELEIILKTETIREVLQRKLITLTPSQWTLLDREHVGLRELLISGSMGLEIEDTPQKNYDALSFTNSSSSIINNPTLEISEKPLNEFREFGDIIGTLRSEDESRYYFPNIYREDSSFQCMLTHVESPDLFYLHVVHIKTAIVDQIAKEIAEFVGKGPMFDGFIDLRQPCVAIDQGDGLWYRCIVLELNPEKTKYFVFFVDFGNTVWVLRNEILPIEKRLLRFPAQAIPCRLSSIKPPKNKLLWPLEAMETFNKIGFYTILTAFMTSSITRERIHDNVIVMEEFLIKLRLFDFENKNECLNDRLVELGYADLIDTPRDPEISFSSFSNSPDELNQWDPMETDFLSPNNNYTYEDDNVQVAIHGHKEPNMSMICRYFKTTKGCMLGDKCKYLHTAFPEKMANKIEIPGSNKVVQLPPVSSFIFCNITAIQSPNIFHITCPNGCFDLTNDIVLGGENLTNILEEKYPLVESDYFQLHKEIQEFYDKQSFPTVSENWENGEIAVAHSEIQEWHRCRIIDPEGVKVFYLDYGYTEIVSAKNIRKIESSFIMIPFQAIECTLSKVTPVSEKIPQAKERFEELVTRRKFLGRVDSNLKLASVSLYFLPNGDEPMDSNLPCKCLNDILCDEGYFNRCEGKTMHSSFEGKKVIISPC